MSIEDPHLEEYSVRFATEMCLIPIRNPEEYVLEVRATLIHEPEEGCAERVGQLDAQVLHLERAASDNYPLSEVFDATQDLCDLYSVLFDERSGEIRASVQDRFEVLGGDVLFLRSIEIQAAHRGRGLGLVSVSRCIDAWAPSSGLVICKPFAMQFALREAEVGDWMRRVGGDRFVRDQRVANAKLTSYWGRLGFQRIGRSAYAAISLALARPSTTEILELATARAISPPG